MGGTAPCAPIECSSTPKQLQEKWRSVVRSWPPALRAAWLRSDEGVAAFGSKSVDGILAQLAIQSRQMQQKVPSASWFDAWWRRNERMPSGNVEHQVRVGAVRMVLSRAKTRYGVYGQKSRRWTPPQAVAVEDFLDEMTETQAMFYSHPASPSAAVIREIEWRRAVEA